LRASADCRLAQFGPALPPGHLSDCHAELIVNLQLDKDAEKKHQEELDRVWSDPESASVFVLGDVRGCLGRLFKECGTSHNDVVKPATTSALSKALFAWQCLLESTHSHLPVALTYELLQAFGLNEILMGRGEPWMQFATLLLARVLSLRPLRKHFLRQHGQTWHMDVVLRRIVDTVIFAREEECPWPVKEAAPLFITFFKGVESWDIEVLRKLVDACQGSMMALRLANTPESAALLELQEHARHRCRQSDRMMYHWALQGEQHVQAWCGESKKQHEQYPFMYLTFDPENASRWSVRQLSAEALPDPGYCGYDMVVQYAGELIVRHTKGEDFRISKTWRRLERDLNPCATCGKRFGESAVVCSRCGLRRYCSNTCQREHWRKHGHRTECSSLKAAMLL